MGKHPCVLIFWGKCRNLLSKINKDKDNAPPFVEISEIVEERPVPDLSFDIITNILIKLPPKCIFRLRQQTNSNGDVLYGLTTDPSFMRKHLDQATTPTIVMQSIAQSVDKDIKLYLFDDKAENVEATSLDLSSCNAYCKRPIDLWGSYEGFLLFKSKFSTTPVFCIWNPITKEQVTVTSPSCRSDVFGFYFHPRKKEYEVISVVALTSRLSDFQILSLRTKHRRSVGSCSSPPDTERSPAFINGTFYWMVDCSSECLQLHAHYSLSDSILSFNIETEEFGTIEAVMPSNDPPLKRRYRGYQFQLFELEGDLSLFDPSSSTEVVIWVFNYSTRRWDKKHSMTSLWFPHRKHHWCFYEHFTDIEYIPMKGEFIAYHGRDRYRPTCIYNLRSGTWKIFEKKGFEKDRIRATIYTQSLVSLDAADSVIPLVES